MPGGGPLPDASARLQLLERRLTDAERVWAEAIDDPWTEPDLKLHYRAMQDLCRECAGRRGGFATIEEKRLCDRVRDPYKIYFNNLYVRVNGLEKQIEIKGEHKENEPSTVAYEYRRRPSRENLERLRRLFDQVHRYYVGWPYTWTRYINKYPFQKARDEYFRQAFFDRDREYLALKGRPGADPRELAVARGRAEFEFRRLKEEYLTNDLPHAGEVNAFYLACSLDDYHRLVEEERALAEERRREGRAKEVVVFIHGLSETRASWGSFPELLSREDVVNDGLRDRYFKVYVFSYDTVEDSKSVEGFKKELDGFIKDILRDEGVEKVHLVGHSFGAVLCLKYLIHQMDPLLEGIDRGNPVAVAGAIVRAYAEGKCRQTVKSFTSVAGSLSGSAIANIAADRFIPREQLFRKALPLMRGGVPGYGDIQVRENQLGSAVNLTSFWRLDSECPLVPQGLLSFLGGGATPPGAVESLREARVPALCLVGDPIKIQSLCHKEGFLKIGEMGNIFSADGIVRIVDSFRREEDDGFVKSYCANLDHTYLLRSGEDIGYRGSDVRYTPYAHFSISQVFSREHPCYRYLVSFLSGNLLPQMEPDLYTIDLFGALLRIFPDGVDPLESPDAYFMPEERVVYLKESKLVLPALRIEPVAHGRRISLKKPQWNWLTGVCLYEGKVRDSSGPAVATFRLRAEGYEERLLDVPVRPGEVSYAVNVVMKKTGGAR